MKASMAATLALAMAGPVSVLADSCNRGGVYCGTSLLNKGNYRDHIIETLKTANQPTDEAHIQKSLFRCLQGGDIAYQTYCSEGCGGVDSKDPDYCF